MSEIRTPQEALEAAAQAARNRVYRDSAGTGFDEDGFEADVVALASRIPPAPDAGALVEALVAEYSLEHALEDDEQRLGRRSAVRGVAVRLGVYAALDAALREAGALK